MIRLEKVTKIYPDGTEAVKEVSFTVDKGEVCVLLGPSGCGKTTTMKMINRLVCATSGKIFIDGIDNTTIDENELRKSIGYAIQDVGLFPHMTVGENIGTVPALKGWPRARQRQRASWLLKLLRLDPDHFIDKYPRELSGGQRQRVGVARALGGDPAILLMDEPFGAIDPITRAELQDEFLKVQQEIQKTIIFVTHDIYEAIKMGDKITLMNQGQIVQYGSPADLLFRPTDAFVMNFVGADRGLKGLHLIHTKDVMWGSAPTAKADEAAADVRKRMKEEGVDWVMVIDNEGRFAGWVAASDLKGGRRVKEVMSTAAITVSQDGLLSDALSRMLSSALNVVAIVDQDKKLQGVLTFEAIQEGLRKAAQKEETE